MSNAIVKSPPAELVTDDAWPAEQVDLLKRTICKDSTDDEFKLFLHVARRAGLDPFARQIHAVRRWNDKAGRYDMIIQTGIDGFRLTAERTGKYAGSDDPVFDDEKKPTRATVTVYKMVDGVRCPFSATARWEEYFPGDKQGFMWRKMPCVMLGKCAEAQALRKAFPMELSAVYSEEELARSEVDGHGRYSSGVHPQRPEEGDGAPREIGWRCPVGTYAKRTFEEVNIEDWRKWVLMVEARAKKEGKPLVPIWQQTVDYLSEQIGLAENVVPDSGE